MLLTNKRKEMDHFTDDSVLTFALAEWALEYGKVPLGDCDTVAAMAGGIAFAYYKKSRKKF